MARFAPVEKKRSVKFSTLPCRIRTLAAALAALAATGAHAADLAPTASQSFAFPEGSVRREFLTLPSRAGGGYDAMVVRPVRGGQFPLLILSHGSPRDSADRAKRRVATWTAVAIEFARQGYAAAAFLRHGFGATGGRMLDGHGGCKNPNYRDAGVKTAAQIAEAIAALRQQSYVDATRIVAVGQSAGGFGALALASIPPDGLVAVLNFAGGRGSPRPDEVCIEDRLVEAVAAYGTTARVPALFVYSENDHYFRPELARRMFDAWTGAGAPGTFVAAPPFGADGHMLFGAAGLPIWRGYVVSFLRERGLPAWSATPPDHTPKVPPPAGLPERGRTSFAAYLRSLSYHKAFALSADGRFAWESGFARREEAAAAALKRCEARGPCRVVLIDDARAD
jgi:dienelactone hydrolase